MGTETPQGATGAESLGGHVGFPPGSKFVMLPRHPARAARAGLALYEAVEPRQRLAAYGGEILIRSGLVGLLPAADRAEVDHAWWAAFFRQVAEPVVGPVARCAYRVPGNPRVSALAMDASGHPIAFAKLLNAASPALPAAVSDVLSGSPTESFRVPAVLGEGEFRGRTYRLLQPLPEGLHHPPGYDPPQLWRVVDELHDRLSVLPRPHGVPTHYVLCHADLTPRNIRVAADDRWWLFDWDTARWGPRLSDELRYWCAWFAYRWRPSVERDAARIHHLLQRRGSDHEIAEAVAWSDRVRQTYRSIESQLLEAVGAAGR